MEVWKTDLGTVEENPVGTKKHDQSYSTIVFVLKNKMSLYENTIVICKNIKYFVGMTKAEVQLFLMTLPQ